MSVWLGKPGFLAQVKSPRRGVAVETLRQATVRTTIGGGRVVDSLPGILRTWTWEHQHLTTDAYGALAAYIYGHHGPGPWILIDEADRNLLAPNQSGSGSVDGDATGFTVTAGTLSVASWGGPRGPRQLAWDLEAGEGTLTMDPQRSTWLGVPVIPGRTYRWQSIVSSDGQIPVTPRLTWLTASGATITTSSGVQLAADVTGTAVWVEDVCPLSAVWVTPMLIAQGVGGVVTRAGGGTPTVSGPGFGPAALLIDRPQLSMPSTRDPGDVWVPGLGVPLVSATAMTGSLAWVDRRDASLTLTEVR